ncbi:MAG: glycosyltransferase [Candidatus Magasanikbacteria bacterium]|nr:glycosyltransferase [Candidatus Magasanikbacteria bacterium]
MVSVIIPAFNEEELLPQCLTSLSAQKGAPPFEVIIVNNFSTDRTRLAAEQFRGRLNLRVVDEPRRGRGQARARGFAEAQGEILLSTDADAILPEHWVAALTQALQNQNIAAVTGPARVADCGALGSALFNGIFLATVRVYRLLFGHVWLGGYNFGIRRPAYQAAGGFNAALNAMEDVDLGWRVHRSGGSIRYLPRAGVTFSGRRFRTGISRGLWDYLRLFYRYRRGAAAPVVLSDVR